MSCQASDWSFVTWAELAVAQDVAARIADLTDDERRVDEGGHGAGRAHAALALVVARLDEDALVGELDRAPHEAREGVARQRLGRAERLVDRIDRHLRRHLARGRAAHAVAHEQEGALVAELDRERLLAVVRAHARRDVRHEEVVLVVLADQTDVGLSEDLDVDGGRAV